MTDLATKGGTIEQFRWTVAPITKDVRPGGPRWVVVIQRLVHGGDLWAPIGEVRVYTRDCAPWRCRRILRRIVREWWVRQEAPMLEPGPVYLSQRGCGLVERD